MDEAALEAAGWRRLPTTAFSAAIGPTWVKGDAGAELKFEEVLMIGGTEAVKVGKPTVSGAKVTGKIMRQAKARRVLHFRKEKEGWTRLRGHRQPFTEVKITSISA